MVNVIIFFLLSVLLAYASRASLKVRHSHGFYRFVAAELLLILVLLNADRWFENPISPRQCVSWFLLLTSVILVANAVYWLRQLGAPDDRRRSDIPLARIEKTTRLVTTGIFKYIRHPMYASAFYGTWGVFLKSPSWVGWCLAAGTTVFLIATAKIEERENLRYFGAEYEAYMRRTRLFVPLLF